MSNNLNEIESKIDRLELLLSLLIMNEMAKGDPKFMLLIKELLEKQPSGYFDDLWAKYKGMVSSDTFKISQIDVLNERINLVDKLFNELKHSTGELSGNNT